MPQRYKLRLSDGTFMSVDLEGLRAWADDAGALAQAVGSQQWRPLRDVLVEEESALRLLRALVHPQPRQGGTTPPPPPPATPPPGPFTPAEPSPAFSEPPAVFGEPPPAFGGPPSAFGGPATPFGEAPAPFGEAPAAFSEPQLPIGAPRDLQVLADEPVADRSPGASGSDDAMPAIRMKPLEEEPRFRSAWDEAGQAEEPEEVEEEPRPDRLEGPLLTVLEGFGGFLSRVLDRLTPLVQGVRSRLTREAEPPDEPAPRSVARPAAVRASPAPSVLTVAEDPGSARAARQKAEADRPSVFARVSAWLRSLRAPAPGPEREERPAPAPPVSAKPRMPVPRAPAQAPPPVSELPVVPFAPSREPRTREDVYEGDDEPSFSLSLEPIWYWTKRIVVAGALGLVVGYGVLERDTWFPKAADLGQRVFTEIDRQVFSRQRHNEQQRALAEASERLPQLAPETIQLFFSRSPTGVVEAPDLFELARKAADRGRPTLTRAEAEELASLEGELLGGLSRPERERVREYDRNRARRPIFPFENPHVMELVARGARKLPPEGRARLQALTQKAVVAGVDLPESQPATSAAR